MKKLKPISSLLAHILCLLLLPLISVELQKRDSIYLFSDGFADQFGGEKNKKFKTINLKRLLLSIQKESMEKQKLLLDEAFENWKGINEQIDDVCEFGVRIQGYLP